MDLPLKRFLSRGRAQSVDMLSDRRPPEKSFFKKYLGRQQQFSTSCYDDTARGPEPQPVHHPLRGNASSVSKSQPNLAVGPKRGKKKVAFENTVPQLARNASKAGFKGARFGNLTGEEIRRAKAEQEAFRTAVRSRYEYTEPGRPSPRTSTFPKRLGEDSFAETTTALPQIPQYFEIEYTRPRSQSSRDAYRRMFPGVELERHLSQKNTGGLAEVPEDEVFARSNRWLGVDRLHRAPSEPNFFGRRVQVY